MKSIIITGEQGSGKTTLATKIAEMSSNYIFSDINLSNINNMNKDNSNPIIVIDELTGCDIERFNYLISKRCVQFIPPCKVMKITLTPTIIGVFQKLPNETMIRKSLIFKLVKF